MSFDLLKLAGKIWDPLAFVSDFGDGFAGCLLLGGGERAHGDAGFPVISGGGRSGLPTTVSARLGVIFAVVGFVGLDSSDLGGAPPVGCIQQEARVLLDVKESGEDRLEVPTHPVSRWQQVGMLVKELSLVLGQQVTHANGCFECFRECLKSGVLPFHVFLQELVVDVVRDGLGRSLLEQRILEERRQRGQPALHIFTENFCA